MKKMSVFTLVFFFLLSIPVIAQIDKSDWEANYPDGCTSITVGKMASFDGSVMTSHTDDSHRTRSWANVIPAANHKVGDMVPMFKRVACDSFDMPTYAHRFIGEIPQAEHTFQYINTAYPCLNEKQLGIGESTFGGRDYLQSNNGLIDCQRLCQLMLERTTTAREAISLASVLLEKYGWIDSGECLTIADPKEVWHLEIVGPGKGNLGAIWVAQRVPDNHVGVNANASTIKKIDLSNSDYFMASENIFEMAIDSGWCNSKADFEFCYAYAPHSRQSVAARRREWRVFDLLAPSLNFNANDQDYPFSIEPDNKITLEDMRRCFADYYEGTPYDMTRTLQVKGKDGKSVISPLANPQMPYDQLEMESIRGGWFSVNKESGSIRFLGERTIARWYTMYGTIIQCRDWLPNEIGGIVWLAQDNIATSIYVPFYCSVSYLPESYETPGRPNGFTYGSAWWAFNRLGTLSVQRWGDMRHDVEDVWRPMQQSFFQDTKSIDKQALELYSPKKPKKTVEFLTKYSNQCGEKVVDEAWKLGNKLWTKYDEKF